MTKAQRLALSSIIGLASVFAFSTVNSYADDAAPQWEVTGASALTLSSTSSGNQSGAATSTVHAFGLNGGANYYVMPDLEAGINLGFNISNSSGNTTTVFQPEFVLTYNFMGNATNAYFVQGDIGFQSNYAGANSGNYTPIVWGFAAGKRFELTSHVAFKPDVFVQRTGSATATQGSVSVVHNSTTSWGITPVQFTFIF